MQRIVDAHFHLWDLTGHLSPFYPWLHTPRVGSSLGD